MYQEAIVFKSFKEAEKHISNNYWVVPIEFPPTDKGEQQQQLFDRYYCVSVTSDDGFIHYVKRN